jgi:hypothetical protein
LDGQHPAMKAENYCHENFEIVLRLKNVVANENDQQEMGVVHDDNVPQLSEIVYSLVNGIYFYLFLEIDLDFQ